MNFFLFIICLLYFSPAKLNNLKQTNILFCLLFYLFYFLCKKLNNLKIYKHFIFFLLLFLYALNQLPYIGNLEAIPTNGTTVCMAFKCDLRWLYVENFIKIVSGIIRSYLVIGEFIQS